MPNWCSNILEISGNTDKFKEFIKQNKFSFNSFIPVGEENIFAQSSAWGTKWDLADENNEVYPDEQKRCADDLINNNYTQFDTAWSPPIPVIEKITEMFPEMSIKLYYYEPGMLFYGDCIGENGSITDNYAEGDPSDEFKEKFGYFEDEEE